MRERERERERENSLILPGLDVTLGRPAIEQPDPLTERAHPNDDRKPQDGENVMIGSATASSSSSSSPSSSEERRCPSHGRRRRGPPAV
jgi:hypothetical protein